MNWDLRQHPFLLVLGLALVAILFAAVLATGVGPLPSSTSGVPNAGTPAPPAATGSQVFGSVASNTRHLGGHTWMFSYTVKNTGRLPITAFQVNGARAHLFDAVAPAGWKATGPGVCGGRPSRVLIFWSTTEPAAQLRSNATAHFSFRVNTRGTRLLTYFLSWRTALPSTGRTQGPAGSSLPRDRANLCR